MFSMFFLFVFMIYIFSINTELLLTKVLLLDLCLDDEVEGCEELSPSSLQHISHNVKDMVGYRYSAISRSKHLCIEIGGLYIKKNYY